MRPKLILELLHMTESTTILELDSIGMDSMAVRNGYWTKSWKIPGTIYTICGYSRAAYRTGFYIKELDLMLDAGPQNFNKPKHIMITHMHDDHVAELPLTLIPGSPDAILPTIYTPIGIEEQLAQITRGMTYTFQGLEPGQHRVNFNNNPLEVHVIDCDHSVDTISFGFSLIKNKLKPEYQGLGRKIKELRDSGVEVTTEVLVKQFAFICDTSIHVFDMHPEILEYPIIFIECTFLMPEDIDNAEKTKHIHWLQLEPYVRAHPDVTFMLFHFSLRLGSDETIREFFRGLNIHNVLCWA